MDGYNQIADQMKECSSAQKELNQQLADLGKEIAQLPPMPYSIDQWVDDMPMIDQKSFGLDTYEKLNEYRKTYFELIERSENNILKMKVLQIDDLLLKIEKVNKILSS